MEFVQIDNLVKGIATGKFAEGAGNHFGSLWALDGLLQREASPEERAAFGGSSDINLCHGNPVTWLGQQWSAILTYRKQRIPTIGHGFLLNQVNINTGVSDKVFAEVYKLLEGTFGKGQEVSMPQDAIQGVQRRTVWEGPGGVATLVRTPTYIQISVGPKNPPQETGCLGTILFLVGTGALLYAAIA